MVNGDPASVADMGIAMGMEFGASGYYGQYGGFSTALMIAGSLSARRRLPKASTARTWAEAS